MYTVLDKGLNPRGFLSEDSGNGSTPFWDDEINIQIADDGGNDNPLDGLAKDINQPVDPNSNSKSWNHTLTGISFRNTNLGKQIQEDWYVVYKDASNKKSYLMQLTDITESAQGSGDHYKTANGINSAIIDFNRKIVPAVEFIKSGGVNVLPGKQGQKYTGSLKNVLLHAFSNTGWEIQMDSYGYPLIDYKFDGTSNAQAALQDICRMFDVEMDAYVELSDAGRIRRKVLKVSPYMGKDNGVLVRYGYNLMGISKQTLTDQMFTKLYVKGGNDKDGNSVTFKEINRGLDYVIDDNANNLYNPSGHNNYPRTYREGVITNDVITEPVALLTWAKKMLKLVNHPRANYHVDTLATQNAQLGDTIRVQDLEASEEILLTSRVIQKKISFANPTNNQLVLGEFNSVGKGIPRVLTQITNNIQAINTTVNNVADRAASAVTVAGDAYASALNATKGAAVAKAEADLAKTGADSAKDSATKALTQAGVAQQASIDAKTQATAAHKSADDATTFAKNAQTNAAAATSASKSAFDAATSAVSLANQANDDLIDVTSQVKRAYSLADASNNLAKTLTANYDINEGDTVPTGKLKGDTYFLHKKNGYVEQYSYDGTNWQLINPDTTMKATKDAIDQAQSDSDKLSNKLASEVQSNLDSAKNDIATVTKAVSDYNSNNTALTAKITTAQTTADGVKTTVSDSKTGLSAVNQKVDSLTTTVSSAAGDISTLKQNATSFTASIASLNTATPAKNIIASINADTTGIKLYGKYLTLDGNVTITKDLKVPSVNISGKLTADQIDATNLHVKSANVDGTLTAKQIDTSGVKTEILTADTITTAMLSTTDFKVNGNMMADGAVTLGLAKTAAVTSAISKQATTSLTDAKAAAETISNNKKVSTVVTYYQPNAAFTTAPTVARGATPAAPWSTTYPTVAKGSTAIYVWATDKINFADGTFAYTAPYVVQGGVTINSKTVFNDDVIINGGLIGTGIKADNISTGNLDASKVTVKNLKANSIIVGSTPLDAALADNDGVLNDLGDNINGINDGVSQLQSDLDTARDDLRQKLSETNDNVNNVLSHVEITPEGHIKISADDASLELELSDNSINFLEHGEKVAYINNKRIHITNAEILSSMQIANYHFIPRSNGSLSFVNVH